MKCFIQIENLSAHYNKQVVYVLRQQYIISVTTCDTLSLLSLCDWYKLSGHIQLFYLYVIDTSYHFCH